MSGVRASRGEIRLRAMMSAQTFVPHVSGDLPRNEGAVFLDSEGQLWWAHRGSDGQTLMYGCEQFGGFTVRVPTHGGPYMVLCPGVPE